MHEKKNLILIKKTLEKKMKIIIITILAILTLTASDVYTNEETYTTGEIRLDKMVNCPGVEIRQIKNYTEVVNDAYTKKITYLYLCKKKNGKIKFTIKKIIKKNIGWKHDKRQ